MVHDPKGSYGGLVGFKELIKRLKKQQQKTHQMDTKDSRKRQKTVGEKASITPTTVANSAGNG